MLEFLERLVAEVATIDEKEHPLGPAELNEPVDEVDGGEGLAAASGHLDQGARTVLGQRLFEIRNGGDLRGPEAGGDQRWQRPQTSAEGGRLICCQGCALKILWDFATFRD